MKKLLISIFASIVLLISLSLLTSPLQLNASTLKNKAELANGTYTAHGVSVTVLNEIVTVNGSVTPGIYNKNLLISNITNLAKNTTYTISVFYVSGSSIGEDSPKINLTSATSTPVNRHSFTPVDSDGFVDQYQSRTGKSTYTFTTGTYDVNAVRLELSETYTYSNWKFRIQIEQSSVGTSWTSAFPQPEESYWLVQDQNRFHVHIPNYGTRVFSNPNVYTTEIYMDNLTKYFYTTHMRIQFWSDEENLQLAEVIIPQVEGFDFIKHIRVNAVGTEYIVEVERQSGTIETYSDEIYWNDERLFIDTQIFFDSFDYREPVLNGQTAFVTNIDNPLPESTIRSYISAFDEVDGDVSHLIQLESFTYMAPFSVGQFELNYSVTDSSGNTAYLKVFVLVRDVTSPSVNPFELIDNISYTQVFNIQTLKNDIMLHASDNFYTKDQLTLTLDSDGYTANKTVPGSYDLLFTLKDPSNNTYQFPITIYVIDDIAPIVSYNPVIVKPATSNLTISDILKDVTATDAIDGNVTNSLTVVSDGYTGNGNRVGAYQIVLEVSDLSGNVNQFTISVEVLDNVPPVFMVIPGHFIRVEQIVTLTNEEIIEILQRTGQLQINGAMSWSYITNEYSGNEEIPGLYAMSMRFVSPSGSTEIESFVIEVLPSVDWDGVVEDANTWYEDFVEWMKDHPIYTVLIFLGATLALIGLTVVIVQLTSSHPHTRKTKYSKYIGKR